MTGTVTEALDAARTAYARATEALRLAEAAAREAGVEVTPTVVDELTVRRLNVVEDDAQRPVVLDHVDPFDGQLVHDRRRHLDPRLARHRLREPQRLRRPCVRRPGRVQCLDHRAAHAAILPGGRKTRARWRPARAAVS